MSRDTEKQIKLKKRAEALRLNLLKRKRPAKEKK
jgi:hypothetical protein